MSRYCPSSQWLVLVLACALIAAPVLADDPVIEGFLQPHPELLIGGQPAPHELVAARDAGIGHVINARGDGEFDAWDESALVDALGMQYHRIPIARADDLNRATVAEFDRVLDRIDGEAAMLHCGTGNRIGALYALRAGRIEGQDAETAIEIGKAHGLAGLEEVVRQKLQEPEEE